jgi:hypothetical protein
MVTGFNIVLSIGITTGIGAYPVIIAGFVNEHFILFTDTASARASRAEVAVPLHGLKCEPEWLGRQLDAMCNQCCGQNSLEELVPLWPGRAKLINAQFTRFHL